MIQADEEQNEEVAQLHAAIKHQGPNQQYALLHTPAKHHGITFKLLIDLGATHSFISIACVQKLKLPVYFDSKLKVKLATGKLTQTSTIVGNLDFQLGGYQTTTIF